MTVVAALIHVGNSISIVADRNSSLIVVGAVEPSQIFVLCKFESH